MIAISGGGTGGHLAIVQSLRDEFYSQGIKTIYIGSTGGKDIDYFGSGKKFENVYFLPSIGFAKNIFNKIKAIIYLVYSIFLVLFIFRKHKISKVISVGGYSSAPASFASIIARKDLYIHEQNIIPGRLNKICKTFCKTFFSAFDGDNHTIVPYPIKKDFIKKARIRQECQSIIFLGGSLGAVFINDLALKMAKYLDDKGIFIIHQCGSRDYQRVASEYEKMNIKADVFDFDSKLANKMNRADLAISRAGASSMFELVANNLPSIFIPYPYAIFNHQFHNAKYLVDKKMAYMQTQKDFDDEKIIKIIDNLCQKNSSINNISVKLSQLNSDNGAFDIVQNILQNK